MDPIQSPPQQSYALPAIVGTVGLVAAAAITAVALTILFAPVAAPAFALIGTYGVTALFATGALTAIISLAAAYLLRPVNPERQALKKELEAWKKTQPTNSKTKEATEAILKCYDSKDTTLDLSWMSLTTLPDAISKLTQLTTLKLWNTKLTTLSGAISKLTQLTTLDLSCNQLTAIPEAIGNLTKLKELNLWGNELTSLPKSLKNIPALTKLSVNADLQRQANAILAACEANKQRSSGR